MAPEWCQMCDDDSGYCFWWPQNDVRCVMVKMDAVCDGPRMMSDVWWWQLILFVMAPEWCQMCDDDSGYCLWWSQNDVRCVMIKMDAVCDGPRMMSDVWWWQLILFVMAPEWCHVRCVMMTVDTVCDGPRMVSDLLLRHWILFMMAPEWCQICEDDSWYCLWWAQDIVRSVMIVFLGMTVDNI